MTNRRQREKFDVTRHRTATWIAAAGAVVTVTFALLTLGRSEGPYAVLIFLGACVVLGLTAVVTAPLFRRRRARLPDAVRAAHPGAPVIPARSAPATRKDAGLAGAATDGLGKWTTSTIALAVLPDRVEVWVRGDQRPRWAVRRADAEIGVESLRFPGQTPDLPGIRMSDGERSVHFIPYYPDIRRRRQVAHLERALHDLGENPADHLRTR